MGCLLLEGQAMLHRTRFAATSEYDFPLGTNWATSYATSAPAELLHTLGPIGVNELSCPEGCLMQTR